MYLYAVLIKHSNVRGANIYVWLFNNHFWSVRQVHLYVICHFLIMFAHVTSILYVYLCKVHIFLSFFLLLLPHWLMCHVTIVFWLSTSSHAMACAYQIKKNTFDYKINWKWMNTSVPSPPIVQNILTIIQSCSQTPSHFHQVCGNI